MWWLPARFYENLHFVVGYRFEKKNYQIFWFNGTKWHQDLYEIVVSRCLMVQKISLFTFSISLIKWTITSVDCCKLGGYFFTFYVLKIQHAKLYYLWRVMILILRKMFSLFVMILLNRQYLQEESKAKKNLDINVSSWILYSMKPHVCATVVFFISTPHLKF